MSSKKKLIISLSVAAAVLVAAIIAIVAVFAAAQQTLTSQIKVTYSAGSHVAGTAKATYTYGANSKAMTIDGEALAEGNTNTVLLLDPLAAEGTTSSLAPQDNETITLGRIGENGAYVGEVIFEFTFTNSGQANYAATLSIDTDDDNTENVIVEVKNGDKWEALADANKTLEVLAGNASTEFKYSIKIRIDNAAKDANYQGSFGWNLLAQE